MNKIVCLCLRLMMACVLLGCGVPRTELRVASQPNVNPDYSGRPSPVIVKIYELRRPVAFRQAEFATLFENPMQTLGADLLGSDELVFVPGEARTVAYMPHPEVRFLGIVAGFRQMERGNWRALRPIESGKKNRIALELNDTSIIVIPDSEVGKWNPEETVKRYEPPAEAPPVAPAPPKPSEEQTLSAYDGEKPQRTPPRPTPEELQEAQRRPGNTGPTPGMAEPVEPRRAGYQQQPQNRPSAGQDYQDPRYGRQGYPPDRRGGQDYQDPRYGRQDYQDPRYGRQGYEDPRYGRQGYEDPRYGRQGYPQDPRYGRQGYQDPRYGSPVNPLPIMRLIP